jgi:hypothetical protein
MWMTKFPIDLLYVDEGFFRPIYVDDGISDRSMLMMEFSDRPMWITEFSVTLMFWACVTLGFYKNVYFVYLSHTKHYL